MDVEISLAEAGEAALRAKAAAADEAAAAAAATRADEADSAAKAITEKRGFAKFAQLGNKVWLSENAIIRRPLWPVGVLESLCRCT